MKTRDKLGSRRGSAMVEFALCAWVLITMFTAIFQFGYSMYLYNELVATVRSGARYASLAEIDNNADGSVPTTYATAVENMVAYGTPSPGTGPTALVTGLTPGIVTVAVTFDGKNVPTAVSVSISSYTISAIVASYVLTGKPKFTLPYFGKYCSNGTTC